MQFGVSRWGAVMIVAAGAAVIAAVTPAASTRRSAPSPHPRGPFA
ncbi:Hypothetical protein RY70_186 [Bifidobacterium bifidum]|nr:Hypothetical protein RY70_186 [Bifidobacterium bifidum]ERI82450.1 hypothetical protein BIFBIF_01825 [Bifidobacterium bifidum ATCC 29521 = JCM 1255 = DSM 20456]